jgi:signal transduction histidine kinase
LHPYVLIPLFAGVAAAMAGSSILTRDSVNRGHRLLAAIFGGAAYWSLLEVIWNSLDEPTWVSWLLRCSSIGWMPLGALCLHLFFELIGDTSSRLRRRCLPALYALAAVSIAIYIATPWGIESVHRTSWGWSFTPGPLFFFLYAPTAGFVAVCLAVLWFRVYPPGAPISERRQGYLAFAAIAIPLVLASVTDAILPLCDIHVPRLGSASLAILGGAIAWSVHRYGYSLLAPGTFASEILATLRDGVALVRHDGLIRTANASLARLCGCGEHELVGRAIADFIPDYSRTANQEVDEHECQLISDPEQPIPIAFCSSAILDRLGDPVGQVLVVRDLREVTALRSRLIMSGRLAAVGELAAGIAHEINNPIAFVKSNLNQLIADWEGAEKCMDPDAFQEGRELLEESLEGASRVADIVKDVRGFAYAGRGERETADVNDLLAATLRIAEPQLRHRANVELDFGGIPLLLGRVQELKQIFLNLLLNASHAIADGGNIRISTEFVDPNVLVRIEDDGCGMAPDLLERIFDPFFSTKKVGEGMGLGLSLSYRMVKNHGGEIRVESEPGRGTCFSVSLPTR